MKGEYGVIPKEQHAMIPNGMEVINSLHRLRIGDSAWIYPASIDVDSYGHLYVKKTAAIEHKCDKPKMVQPSNYTNNIMVMRIQIDNHDAVVLDISESHIVGWEPGLPELDNVFHSQFGSGYYPVAEIFKNGESIGRFIMPEITTTEPEAEEEVSTCTPEPALSVAGMVVKENPDLMTQLRKKFFGT